MDTNNAFAKTVHTSDASVGHTPGLDTAAAQMACAMQPLLPQVSTPRTDGRGAIKRHAISPMGRGNKGKCDAAQPKGRPSLDSVAELSEDSSDVTSVEACPPARKRKRINLPASVTKRKVSGHSISTPPSGSPPERQSSGRLARRRQRASKRCRRAGGVCIGKKYILSAELAAVVGVAAATHGEVSELMWKYIRAHELQDHSSPAYILCDARLKKVMGKERFKGFIFQKYIKSHYLRPLGESGLTLEHSQANEAKRNLWQLARNWLTKWLMKM